jgi:transcriptional regulator with XRE-family HTH domain
MNYAEVGRRVCAMRKARGWTHRDLAAKARVHKNTVINIEKAKSGGTVDVLGRVADALGVPLAELLPGSSHDPGVPGR